MNVIRSAWSNIVNTVDKKIIKFILISNHCIYCGKTKVIWRNRISNVFSCNKCVPKNCCSSKVKVKRAAFLIQTEKDMPCGDWEKI